MSIKLKKLKIAEKLAWVTVWLLDEEDRYYNARYTLGDACKMLDELISEKEDAKSICREEGDTEELPPEKSE